MVLLTNRSAAPSEPRTSEAQRWSVHWTRSASREKGWRSTRLRALGAERVLSRASAALAGGQAPRTRAGRYLDRTQPSRARRSDARAAEIYPGASDEPVAAVSASAAQKLMHSVGLKREGIDAARERAMQALAARLDANIRDATNRLIQLHGLHGAAADTVLQRMKTHFAIAERVDETRAGYHSTSVRDQPSGP